MSIKKRVVAAISFLSIFVFAGICVSYMSGGGVLSYKGSGVNSDDRIVTVTAYVLREVVTGDVLSVNFGTDAGIIEAKNVSEIRAKIEDAAGASENSELYHAVSVIQNADTGSIVLEGEQQSELSLFRVVDVSPRVLGKGDSLGPVRLAIGEITADGRTVIAPATRGGEPHVSSANGGFTGPLVVPNGGGALMLMHTVRGGVQSRVVLAVFADALKLN